MYPHTNPDYATKDQGWHIRFAKTATKEECEKRVSRSGCHGAEKEGSNGQGRAFVPRKSEQ